ncbi:AAA family ATPase [Dyadobacter frigoris]|uniref:ATP-binding protein n=1 Tax=Dyadobacter frigoris TaxID=2576211 RepID=A0A4U6DAX3_9BACT|nr:ATP-binding protein [Dyadobacter frigoris]TKT93348.1 ATP-binding protein [Dyadobacter frigoris]GLU54659.1 ATPase [Dyadobacter frigoris]
MYTEILKIIEGGLSKDFKKVHNYSKLLADKLAKDGDEKMAKLILRAIENGPATTVVMDELLTTPVDQESRLSIVDISRPLSGRTPVILPQLIENKIDDFINVVKHQSELIKNGIETTNTLLLYGKPGCGKTTVAQYISDKTGLPLVVARFDAIVSSLLGNTAKNIRKIFDFADNKPCILFLDEFDAIAKARDDQYELGELKRVINSLLQNIDAFASHNILIAATNHPELLDKAIWRRFNTVIEIGAPQEAEVSQLIKVFTAGFKTDFIDDERRHDKLVKLLTGKSPSDIKGIINNAKAHTIINGRETLAYEDLLVELFEFTNHGDLSIEKLVEFLNDNGIPQVAIAERMKISIRQVRNFLNKNI